MASRANFPFFLRLPREVQDNIWKVAIDLSPPTAYFAELELYEPNDEDGPDIVFKRLYQPHELASAPPPSNTIESLLQTCKRSRAAVIRYRRKYQHICISTLAYFEDVPSDDYDTSLRTITKAPLGINLDPSSDLLILDDSWRDEYVLRGCNEFRKQTGIRNIAVPWTKQSCLTADDVLNILFYAEGIIQAFPSLEVLYVVVEPTELEEATGNWPYHDEDPEMALKPYVENNYEEGGAPREFRVSGRQYFEVSPLQLTTLGGLRDFVLLLGDHRYCIIRHIGPRTDGNVDELAPFVVRVMTWRNEE
ncbi:hypothetical protein Daesc_001929 [Daldinia eschscholtzii]|uniref:2EXR domain-containing protein n=1 Tax=Daldinia eschscholtzii TaxID=292717 RepID=A0AAX6MVF9_9PEZI